jgi:hypothetical protein
LKNAGIKISACGVRDMMGLKPREGSKGSKTVKHVKLEAIKDQISEAAIVQPL